MIRPDTPAPDMVDELCKLLREANLRPYIDTYYLSPEQRVRAFRMRAAAFLTGRRAPFRHRGPGP